MTFKDWKMILIDKGHKKEGPHIKLFKPFGGETMLEYNSFIKGIKKYK